MLCFLGHRRGLAIICGAVGIWLAGCSDPAGDASDPKQDAGDKDAGVEKCEVQAPTACPTPEPTYADVAPIFERRCVGCHAGVAGGPWPLMDYSHVSSWQDDIRTDMLDCSMPPADQVTTMPVSERLAILDWIRCGLPE